MRIVEKNRVRGQQYVLTLEGGEFDEVTVDAATFDESSFGVGGCIDHEQLARLLGTSRYSRAKSRALYYLAGRDYAAKELERKLYRCTDRETAAQVVARLTEVGLVDDAAYAARLAHTLLTYKRYPKRRVLQTLQEKGVARHLAEAALEELEADDFQQALALIQKKYYNKVQDWEDRQKTIAALARYGFPYDVVRRAVEVAADRQNEEDWY